MAFIQKDKIFSRKWLINYIFITVGAFILAAGFVFFIAPYRIVPGGVYGVSIVIHYMTKGVFSFAPEGLPIGTVGFLLNIPLTIVGIKILGPRFGVKTIVGFFLTSFFIDFQTYLWGYEPLVPDDPLISSIFGALLFGVGMGLIFKSQASSGGTDIIGMIIFKYTHIPIGQAIIIVDSFVVLLGLAAFRDWKIPLYSWLVIFITGKVIDAVMQGIDYEKAVFIISDHYERIREKILYDLGRGGTLIVGTGMYHGVERNMIYTVISRRELVMLRDFVKEIDPAAFMVVINANEVLGEGFKPLKSDQDIDF